MTASLAQDISVASSTGVAVERGQRAVFCGLTSIIWLHRRIQDAFFLVVGSRTCAHLLQSAAGVMIFAEPRFATAILQERDLAGLSDCHEELDRVVAALIQRRPDIKRLFLVGSCPSEVIKLDLHNAAHRLQQRLGEGLRISAFSGSGIETTFTQGEDQCLFNLVPELPDAGAGRSLMVVGTLPDIVEDQFRRLFDQLGIGPVDFFPGRDSLRLPSVGSETQVLLAQPYLSETVRALEARGAQVIAAPFPLGAEGSWAWFSAAAHAWQIPEDVIHEVLKAPRLRAERAIAAHRGALEHRRIMFLPDSQLEIPLARFLKQECGMQLVEVGTPYYDQRTMSQEREFLGPGVRVVEGQDLDPALDRVRHENPDLTVCGLGIANPLEALGLRTKWSIELMFSPIQGFDQAGDLASLFARPLNREAQLEIGSWT